jgi:hypothetical protein
MLTELVPGPRVATFQQVARSIAILHVGWQHHYHQNQPHRIDQEVSLTPVNLLAGVIAAFATALTALDDLTKPNPCTIAKCTICRHSAKDLTF